MTAVPVVADRVMKARKETQCSICHGWIRVGQLIARCPGRVWMHASCFIGHRHDADHHDVCSDRDQDGAQ